MILAYEKERINSEFSHDQYIIKIYSVRKEIDEMINLYLERLVSIYSILDIKYNNDPCLYFHKLLGSDLGEIDRSTANFGVNMCDFKKYLEAFLDAEIKNYMPNTTMLIGSTLALEFLHASGGLKNLIKYPSSTLQIIGAERAFFSHMRKGTPPPKHGIIYNYPGLPSLPKNIRGKVARTIANKMAITLKMDYFNSTGNIDEMKKSIEEKMQIHV
ncbi:MAG: hypothetical protein QXZ44_01745 [Ferroplasma sp.]